MNEININLIPKFILKRLASLEEVSMFILENGYIISGKYLNNWEDTLKENLYKIYKRHKFHVNVELIAFDLYTKRISYNILSVKVDLIIDIIMKCLLKNKAVSIIINNYNYKYGYLIIPGEQLKRDKINIYTL